MVYQRAYMPNKAQGVILGENRVTGITPKTALYSNKKVGSSNQTEPRFECRAIDKADLGFIQKKSQLSISTVAQEKIWAKTGSEQAPGTVVISSNGAGRILFACKVWVLTGTHLFVWANRYSEAKFQKAKYQGLI